MTKLSVICGPSGYIPTDDDGMKHLHKHAGRTMTAEFRTQRSPEHNRLFWAIANGTHANLPEPYASNWPTAYDMVKGLQLAFGICDQIKKPIRGSWEIVQIPKSLDFGNMTQDEFNTVSEMLFKGMAHCLGISVEALLDEGRAA